MDTLQELGADAKWSKETKKDLKAGKLYLKSKYRAHCRDDDSQCPDHCRKLALSDADDTSFQTSCEHEHNSICEQCESIKVTIKSIEMQLTSPSMQFYNSEQKEDLKYDFQKAENMVFQWKCHLIRAENQDKAKQAMLLTMNQLLLLRTGP